jgi:hypothetical protein
MLQRIMPRLAYPLLCILLIAAATFVTFRIATTTPFDVHPDEFNHADGFCYYEGKWWPPPLNAEGLRYSPYGMSRLHEEEIVYLLFGKIAALLRPMVEPWFEPEHQPLVERPSHLFMPSIKAPTYCILAFHTYRLLNVALLAPTLALLFWMGMRYRWARSLGFLILAIPQAVYMYAYGNSDAWALSLSAVMLLTALLFHDREQLTWREALWFGMLTGLLFLSKRTFWLTIGLAYLILAHKGFLLWQGEREKFTTLLRSWLPVVLLLTFVLILPMKIIYPLSQGDYEAGIFAMRERTARVDLRPSNPTYPGYLLRQRGAAFGDVWSQPIWWSASYQSFYGVFGYWKVYAATPIYSTAAMLLLLGIACTYIDFSRRRAAYSSLARLLLLATPLASAALIVASLLYSWIFDYQPQGRYLLPTLLPLAFLVGGAVNDEGRWLRLLRLLIWVGLLGISFYTLWELLLAAPTMGR